MMMLYIEYAKKLNRCGTIVTLNCGEEESDTESSNSSINLPKTTDNKDDWSSWGQQMTTIQIQRSLSRSVISKVVEKLNGKNQLSHKNVFIYT
jgi:hypothetical protein